MSGLGHFRTRALQQPASSDVLLDHLIGAKSRTLHDPVIFARQHELWDPDNPP
jgi:hypothetical protein